MSEQKFVNLSNETQASTVQGTSFTAYPTQPVLYANEVLDAAKKRFFFTNFINIVYLPTGHKDYVVRKRTIYLRSDITFDTGEATTSDISNTSLSTLDGETLTPTVVTARFTVTNYAVRTNAFNVVKEAKAELSEGIGDRIDAAVSTAMGDATASADTTQGALALYGGTATADSGLAAGDVITTDLIAEAARYLKDSIMYYRSGGVITEATNKKNPWTNTPDDPFVLFIGPAQEMTLRKDSQFVNAEQYGGNEVVQNGEIGRYLGIKVVVADNVERVAASGTAPDGGSAPTVNMTRCILAKAKKACTLCWGQEPTIDVAPIQWRKQQSIVLECAYAIKVIHDDAIIFIDVADE